MSALKLLHAPRREEPTPGLRLTECLRRLGVLEMVRAGELIVLLNGRSVSTKELEDVVLGKDDVITLLRPVVGG